MKPRGGEWRARLLLVAASSALTFLFAEGAARIALRPSGPIGGGEGTPISEVSETLGWRTRPTGSQVIRREDFEVTVTLNSLGLRGPEIPYEPTDGVRRLAIMGDSFAHGYYAQEPDTLRGRLAAALSACRVDVLNAGGPGYSTDQEWLYYRGEISKYKPSEVVLLFYYNDLQFNIERIGTANRAKPLFVEKDGGLELILPEIRRRAERREPKEPKETRTRPVVRRAAPTFHGSALWAFVASRLQRSRPDWARQAASMGLAPALSEIPPAEYLPFGPMDDREKKLVEEMWKRTAAILSGFRDDVRSGGASFSILYVPSRFEVNDEAWRFVQRRYESGRPWNRDAVRTRLTTLLTTLDIPLIEATPLFKVAESSSSKAYLAIDGHWNARGNAIAFEAVSPSMRRAFGCES